MNSNSHPHLMVCNSCSIDCCPYRPIKHCIHHFHTRKQFKKPLVLYGTRAEGRTQYIHPYCVFIWSSFPSLNSKAGNRQQRRWWQKALVGVVVSHSKTSLLQIQIKHTILYTDKIEKIFLNTICCILGTKFYEINNFDYSR